MKSVSKFSRIFLIATLSYATSGVCSNADILSETFKKKVARLADIWETLQPDSIIPHPKISGMYAARKKALQVLQKNKENVEEKKPVFTAPELCEIQRKQRAIPYTTSSVINRFPKKLYSTVLLSLGKEQVIRAEMSYLYNLIDIYRIRAIEAKALALQGVTSFPFEDREKEREKEKIKRRLALQ